MSHLELQYPKLGEEKTKSEYGWIRARDCYYASLIGYKWFPLNKPKEDFSGREFTHVMCTEGYLDHVLEPDTRVPNFTTDIKDTEKLAKEFDINIQKYIDSILEEVENENQRS